MRKPVFKSCYIVIIILSILPYSCEVDPFDTGTGDKRDNITDTWSCEENSELFGKFYHSADIIKSAADSTKIEIYNFYDVGSAFKISVILSGLSLQIPSQTVQGNTITGNGNISSDYETINFNYSVDDGSGELDHVTATYSRVQ